MQPWYKQYPCKINIMICMTVQLYLQEGYTCLMAACNNGHLDVVEFLLSLPQVDVNARDEVEQKLVLRVEINHAVCLSIY